MSEFSRNAHKLIEWLEKYYETVENYPVLSQVHPGDISKQLPQTAPEHHEAFDEVLADIDKIILPGITHWQSPNFFAYFPANSSPASVLGDLLSSGLGVQGMKWLTSPAATELEQTVMQWLKKMLDLPKSMDGIILDTASVSTLCAILAARERTSDYQTNQVGFSGQQLRVYCSDQAHSSIEKAVRIAGIGSKNMVKIKSDSGFSLSISDLKAQLENDVQNGYKPCCIVGALGTTSSGAIDPLLEMGKLAEKYDAWFHIDAAYSGTAMMLPEFRKTIEGLELAHSFVFNPHKWMFTNFDCSAFFVRDKALLTKTFSLIPEYLQTQHIEDELDYSNWSIQLGRRFRSLKLWMVIRHYGRQGLQKKIRGHIQLGEQFEQMVQENPSFEILTPRMLNIICFRFLGDGNHSEDEITLKNKSLLDSINKSGKLFLTHTELDGKYCLRFVCGQTLVEERHVRQAWKTITELADKL